jgi:hypothetical protein
VRHVFFAKADVFSQAPNFITDDVIGANNGMGAILASSLNTICRRTI